MIIKSMSQYHTLGHVFANFLANVFWRHRCRGEQRILHLPDLRSSKIFWELRCKILGNGSFNWRPSICILSWKEYLLTSAQVVIETIMMIRANMFLMNTQVIIKIMMIIIKGVSMSSFSSSYQYDSNPQQRTSFGYRLLACIDTDSGQNKIATRWKMVTMTIRL